MERMLTLAAKGSWTLTGILCVFFAIFTVVSLERGKNIERDLKRDISSARPKALALEKIGQGPLSLRSSKRKTILPDMSQEVVMLTKNVRPDLKTKEMSFLFSLRSSRVEQRIKN